MLENLLKTFLALKESQSYPWMHQHNGHAHSFHIVLSTLIHGNETGPLPAFIWALQALKSGELSYGGRLTLLLGNPEAARKNQRFLESDLNRMFLDTTLQTHEAKRSREIRPIFDTADLLLDFHQTILPSAKPFYIFPWTKVSAQWARALALADSGIDATPPKGPATTRCADDYVSLRGKPAITIEMGEKGFHAEAETLAKTAIQRVLRIADSLAQGRTTLTEYAQEQPEIELFETVYRERYDNPQLRLRPNLINFLPIQKGEVLSAPGTPPIHAAVSGKLLFPKYPSVGSDGRPLALPKEIFRIIAKAP
ncbi:MAG: succinylglutamate desuccinylase/aspartoacylase family protein [Myxococcota bacterium]|nr:succinylglutamate desuccinylase/aspartoacylase family protein [Myxococcota bacterium]